MEVTYKTLVVNRAWHVYGKTVWGWDALFAKKEENTEALDSDPDIVAWIKNSKSRLIGEVVGHFSREISRVIHFFLRQGGTVEAEVQNERYLPSPIPSGGVEIMLPATFKIADDNRRYLTRLVELIKEN